MRRCGWWPLQIPTLAGMIATERNSNRTQLSEDTFTVTIETANSRSVILARMRRVRECRAEIPRRPDPQHDLEPRSSRRGLVPGIEGLACHESTSTLQSRRLYGM